MLHKLVVGKVDYDPELGKHQRVQILFNFKNELPSATSIDIMKKEFEEQLEIGNVFYENDQEKFYFANISKQLQNSLPDKWKFVPFEELDAKECIDYETILNAIKKLGYELKP